MQKVFLYSYPDSIHQYLDVRTAADSATTDADGNYSFSLPEKQAGVYSIQAGDTVFIPNLFLSPGNHLTLNFEGADRKPVADTLNEEGKYNNFLNQFTNKFYLQPDVHQIYYITSNYYDIFQYDSFINAREKQQENCFHACFKNEKLNEDFKNYILSEIQFQGAVDKLMYIWKKRMKGIKVADDTAYYNFDNPGFIEQKAALNNPSFHRFLFLYVKNLYETKLAAGGYENDPKPFNAAVEKYKMAESRLHKPYSDMYLYNLINTEMEISGNKNLPEQDCYSLEKMKEWFHKKYPDNKF